MKFPGQKKVLLFGLLCSVMISNTALVWCKTSPKTENIATFQIQRSQYQLILDAGHGGEDGGAVSPSGTVESTINLAIVLRLDQLLGLYGIAPILIRNSDISVYDPGCETLRQKKVSDLHNRVSLIESTAHAAVISIHQNIFSNTAYHGTQVFFRDDPKSKELAALTQQSLKDGIDPKNNRTSSKIADTVYLMNQINCPAILIECGFLSNPAEEKKLQDNGYQTQIALCVASAWLRNNEIQAGNREDPMI